MASEPPAGRLRRGLHRSEDGLLAVAVLVMVVLAAGQVIARSVFAMGALWIEPMLRALVLWIGMLGAVVASRGGQHIALDVLTRALPPPWNRRLRAAGCAFTSGVCAALAGHAVRYTLLEYDIAGNAFAAVPTWAVVAILPVAFALIGLRYALFAIAFLRGYEPLGTPTS